MADKLKPWELKLADAPLLLILLPPLLNKVFRALLFAAPELDAVVTRAADPLFPARVVLSSSRTLVPAPRATFPTALPARPALPLNVELRIRTRELLPRYAIAPWLPAAELLANVLD